MRAPSLSRSRHRVKQVAEYVASPPDEVEPKSCAGAEYVQSGPEQGLVSEGPMSPRVRKSQHSASISRKARAVTAANAGIGTFFG
jgi:hypothetical protein